MRYGGWVCLLFLPGCVVSVLPAPIEFKTVEADEPAIDGVELSTLCELASRVGTEYRASDLEEDEVLDLEQQRRYLNILNIDGVVCGNEEAPIDLPFVADPDRRFVSTWGSMSDFGLEDDWGSCLADTLRTPGDRVVFCELGSVSQTAIEEPDFDVRPTG